MTHTTITSTVEILGDKQKYIRYDLKLTEDCTFSEGLCRVGIYLTVICLLRLLKSSLIWSTLLFPDHKTALLIQYVE